MISNTSSENLHFEVGEIEYQLMPDFVLTQYSLGKLRTEVHNASSKHRTSLTMTIPLTRNFNYHLGTIFFPTSCLLVVACLTLFVDPQWVTFKLPSLFFYKWSCTINGADFLNYGQIFNQRQIFKPALVRFCLTRWQSSKLTEQIINFKLCNLI